jgi:putative ABC transport system permease protein
MTFGSGNRASKSTRQELSPSLVQDSLLDFRYSVRGLWRAPVFTLVTILTLALGIGATTAVLTVVHGVLIKPQPLPIGEHLRARALITRIAIREHAVDLDRRSRWPGVNRCP